MRILIVATILFVLGARPFNAQAKVDQLCVSVQTSVCNSALARCQCSFPARTTEPDSVAKQQRQCAHDCQQAYQKCVDDAAHACYR